MIKRTLPLLAVLLLTCAGDALAQEAAEAPLTAEGAQTHLNYVSTTLAAMLVFFMQAGFALLETASPAPRTPWTSS